MPKPLGVIVPTRGRPENLAKVAQAWEETNAWADADLIVVYDADDPKSPEYAELIEAQMLDYVQEQHWMPMVHKLDHAARSLMGAYSALGFAGDDHIPRTEGWTTRYIQELRDLGAGIVHGNDGQHGEKCPTEWAMTSNIIKAMGRMVPAPVEHLYCDNSILDLGTRAGCLKYLPDVMIEHMHPMWKKSEWDQQYQDVNSRNQYRKDGLSYNRWRSNGLAQDVELIRQLKEGLQ